MKKKDWEKLVKKLKDILYHEKENIEKERIKEKPCMICRNVSCYQDYLDKKMSKIEDFFENDWFSIKNGVFPLNKLFYDFAEIISIYLEENEE